MITTFHVIIAVVLMTAFLVWVIALSDYRRKARRLLQSPPENAPPDIIAVDSEVLFALPLSKAAAESLLDLLNYTYGAAIRENETKRAMIAATFAGMVSAELTGRSKY